MKALIAALALVGAGVGQAHAEDWVCTLVQKGKKPTSISGPVYLWVQSATSVYAIDPPLFTIFKKPQPVQVKKNTSSVLRITWNIVSGEDTKGKAVPKMRYSAVLNKATGEFNYYATLIQYDNSYGASGKCERTRLPPL